MPEKYAIRRHAGKKALFAFLVNSGVQNSFVTHPMTIAEGRLRRHAERIAGTMVKLTMDLRFSESTFDGGGRIFYVDDGRHTPNHTCLAYSFRADAGWTLDQFKAELQAAIVMERERRTSRTLR